MDKSDNLCCVLTVAVDNLLLVFVLILIICHRGLRMKNEELSASPIKKQGSAAEGKANVECRIVGFAD